MDNKIDKANKPSQYNGKPPRGRLFKKAIICVSVCILAVSVIVCVTILITSSFDRSFTCLTKISLDKSDAYTKEDMKAAANVVTEYFGKGFPYCTMLSLTYDKDFSEKWASTESRYENVIVLKSSFFVGGKNPVLNPYNLYSDYCWYLSKSVETDAWEIVNVGYA